MYKDVSLKLIPKHGEKKRYAPSIFVSEKFSSILFNGNQSMCKDPNPRNCLRTLFARTMPRYNLIMPGEYHADDLLTNALNNLDRAYLEGVWRYSVSMGKVFGSSVSIDTLFKLPKELPKEGASLAASSAYSGGLPGTSSAAPLPGDAATSSGSSSAVPAPKVGAAAGAG
jgi:hypothetical protein